MSKTAEKNALGEYPDVTLEECHGDTKMMNYCNSDNSSLREGYAKGYDQAMQDFLEKACDYLQKNLWRVVIEDGEFRQRFVTDFKNYMNKEQ